MRRFFQDTLGAAAVEYAIILGVIGIAIGAASLILSNAISTSIEHSAEDIAANGS